MTTLQELVTEVERLGASDKAVPGAGIDQWAGSALSQSLAQQGFPGVLALWGGDSFTAGLLVRPELPWTEWAGVVAASGQGLTIASGPSTLLPQVMVLQLHSDPRAVRRLVSDWDQHARVMTTLHEGLGGRTESLDLVVSMASDSAKAQALDLGSDAARFESAHSAIRRSIDGSPAFRAYADWLDSAIAESAVVPSSTTVFGSWERRVSCWANRLGLLLGDADEPTAPQLWPLVEEFAGVDSGVPVVASWGVQPGEASGESALVQAAETIDETLSTAPDDPVRRGLLEGLLAEGSAYRGLAHAEAVVALDERGEPERAWRVLQSAAWWAARNAGGVPEAIHSGAQLLARRHDWVDVLWVLDRVTKGG